MGVMICYETCKICHRTCTIHMPLEDVRCKACRTTGGCDCGYDLRGLTEQKNFWHSYVICPECGQIRYPSPQSLSPAEYEQNVIG